MEKITLIIGAGVNREINPEIGLGADLIKDISDRVTDRTSPNAPYLSALLNDKLGIDSLTRNSFLIFLDQYRNSVKSASIDAFLDEIDSFPEFKSSNEQFITIGRVLILAHILGYEGKKTKEALENEIKEKKKTWLSVIGELIEKNTLLKKQSLKIVTFNYDRILEFFLLERFNHLKEDAAEFIKNNIIHVYGKIGYIEGMKPDNDKEQKVEFGFPNDQIKTIEGLQDHIKLIHQRTGDNEHFEEIKKIIQGSEKTIVFGYGLDPINNTRLGLHELNNKTKNNFHFNIYPEHAPDFDFTERRRTIEKVRSLVVDADIHFKTCSDFVKKCLASHP